jgi:hypothetical protein
MTLLTIQEALNEINGSVGLTQQEAANELAVAVAAINDAGALTLTNATTDNTISIDQNGNVCTDVATDGAIHIENTGNTGIGLGVYTNIGATASAALVIIKADNVAFDQGLVELVNEGEGVGLFINNDGQGKGLYIDAESTSAPHLHVICGVATTAGDGIVYLQSGSASATAEVLRIRQEGTGEGIVIDQNGLAPSILLDAGGNGAHLRFVGDPTVAAPNDGDFWFDGTNFKCRIGTTTYNVDVTSA